MSNRDDFSITNYSLVVTKSLKNLEIPDKVRDINPYSLECNEIENVSVHPNNKFFYMEDGILFKKSSSGGRELIELVLYPSARMGDEYTIPRKVSVIGPCAFIHAKHLKTVIFADNILKNEYIFLPIFSTEIKKVVLPSFCSYYICSAISKLQLLDVEIFPSSCEKQPKKACTIYKDNGIVFVKRRAVVSPRCGATYEMQLLHCDPNKEGEVFIPFEMNWNEILWQKFSGCKKTTAIVIPKYPLYIPNNYEIMKMEMDSIIPITCPRIKFKYVKNSIFKVNLLLGYLLHPEYYNDNSEWEGGGEYLDYVIKHKNQILPYIFKIDRPDLLEFYAERNCITIKNIEKTFLNPAIEACAIKCIDFLQKFKRTILLSNANTGELFCKEDGITYAVSFSNKENTLLHKKRCIKCDNSLSGDVYLPFNVFSIEKNAFNGCYGITSIIAPKFYEEKFDYEFNDGAIIPLVFPMINFKTVKNTRVKINLLLGYIAHPEYYNTHFGGFLSDYLDQAIRQRKTLIPFILKMDRPEMLEFYASRGCITSKNYETDFLNPAIETKAEKCIDFLKNWTAKNL